LLVWGSALANPGVTASDRQDDVATLSVAVVYGHGDSTRETEDGQPCHHNYWSSNTFIKQEGGWRPVFSHVSGVTCTQLE